MALISGLMTGFVHPKIPFQIQKYDRSRDYNGIRLESKMVTYNFFSRDYNGIRLESKMIPRAKIQYFLGGGFHTRYATSPGRNHHELSSGNDFLEEPFWLTLIKEAFWALKSLFVFLLEQPSQLKYIEWPSFQSTLKTASLTLFLVALLIVALASVDSALSYLLALLLRKPL